MFRTLQRRIAIPFVGLIVVTMLGLGLYLSASLRRDYVANIEKTLLTHTRLAARVLSAPLQEAVAPQQLDSLVQEWAAILPARITIIAPDGTVLAESLEDLASGQMDNHLNRPEVAAALATGTGSATRFSATLGYQAIYAAVTVKSGDETLAVVRLSLPLQEVQSGVTHLEQTLLGATLFASLLAILLAVFIAAGVTRPIRQITEAVTQIDSNTPGVNQIATAMIPSNQEEIARLAQAYNHMAARLSAQVVALEAERNKNAAVLQEMTDGVILVDEHGIIQLVNPSAEKMFEISQEQARGRSLVEALRHHQMVELWQLCLKTRKAQNALLEIATSRLYLNAVATPLPQHQPGTTLLLFQNLTRQRYLETVRRDFVSNISHELRTPLASLKALTETLQSGALDDPPAARRFLQLIETEVDALTQMVAELLELSRIESGRVPLQMRPVHPRIIVTSAVERLRLQAERALLTLNVDCPDDLPLILADPTRLGQVLVNLLHNAIKFTNPGGQINIRAMPGSNQEMILSVSDSGVGIRSEDLPRIFERFYKADRARSSGGGTGLGLAIARHLVEAHHGRIWAESRAGQGSIFYFSIPLADP